MTVRNEFRMSYHSIDRSVHKPDDLGNGECTV